MKTTLNTLENSEIEILGTIPTSDFEEYRTRAIMRLGEGMEIDGFRKGKASQEVLEKHIPEMALLEEMAELAIGDAYPKLLIEHTIDAIGRPAVQIMKIGKGADLEFKIRTAVMPEVTLPKYADIAKKEGKKITVEVTDEEVTKSIEQIQKMRQSSADEPHVHVEGEEHSHDEETGQPLPELTDEFVKGLGPFENVADFKNKLKENLKLEKEHGEHEKNRLAILEKIIEGTKVAVPSILVTAEIEKIMYRMSSDISRMGMKMEDYLKHTGKTEEAIRTEVTPDAEKHVKMELVLKKIAETENIKPNEEEMLAEINRLAEMYKGADPERTRAYVEMVLTHEAVFKFLEGQVK